MFWSVAVALVASKSIYAHDHYDKTISLLAMDARPCTFFTLNGVAEADSTLPASGPWFALPKTNANYRELNAMLLSAKLSCKAITVKTNGTLSCGHATIEWLHFH